MIEVFSPKVAREPREGDIYEFTTDVLTAGNRVVKPGTRLKLGQKTTLAPHQYTNPQGNFWASLDEEEPTVWASIHMIIHQGWVTLVAEVHQEESSANPFWDRLLDDRF